MWTAPIVYAHVSSECSFVNSAQDYEHKKLTTSQFWDGQSVLIAAISAIQAPPAFEEHSLKVVCSLEKLQFL